MAHALDLVGERWALLVVRELVPGAKRYSDLRKDLPGISTNVLSHRLDELEAANVVHRRQLPPPAGSWVYELTDWGAELEPVIKLLGRWGAKSPAHSPAGHLSSASLILSLRTNFDATRLDGFSGRFELRVDADRFRAQVLGDELDVVRGEAQQPDAIIEGAPQSFAAVLYGGQPLSAVVETGELLIKGDEHAAERFLALFTLPDKAEVDTGSSGM